MLVTGRGGGRSGYTLTFAYYRGSDPALISFLNTTQAE